MPPEESTKRRHLQPEEIVTLSQEIQSMISAGVPLDVGMRSAAGGFTPGLEEAAGRIANRLEQGATISEAFRDEGSVPPLFRSILVAGLECGKSEDVLRDVTELTRVQIALKQALKIGFIYPTIIIFGALILFFFVIAELFPRLMDLYDQLRIEVPGWMSVVSNLYRSQATLVVILLLFVVSLIGLFRAGRRTPLGGFVWVPGVSSVLNDFAVAHFSHLLALLVKYGIPLPDALRLTGETIQDGPLKEQTLELIESVERGEPVSSSLTKSQKAFPPFLRWLLIAGEEDSDLGQALSHAAEFYQDRASAKATWLSKVVPAATVVVVGGSVTAVYAFSVFGPMIGLWSKLAQ